MRGIIAGFAANVALIVGGNAVTAWFAALSPFVAFLVSIALVLALGLCVWGALDLIIKRWGWV